MSGITEPRLPDEAVVPGAEAEAPIHDDIVIRLRNVSRVYKFYESELDRVKEILTGKSRHRDNVALQSLDLDVRRGEVLGVIGKNGAGKSTLLKLLAKTAQPSTGTLEIHGRIAALLELGASFHPEMTGHENIYLNCAILGLSRAQTDTIYEDIVNFSGIREFIQRPVKTYSSGMFVRLAFSVACHIDPEILIIDEALSVGDGAFARKSFDRIMSFKRAGKTILFCTHSLFQIESICDRVLWLDKGRVRALGAPADVVSDYGEFLRTESPLRELVGTPFENTGDSPPVGASPARDNGGDGSPAGQAPTGEAPTEEAPTEDAPTGEAPTAGRATTAEAAVPRIIRVRTLVDGHEARAHVLQSGESSLEVHVSFSVPASLPMASVGIAISGGDGRILASIGTVNDGIAIRRDQAGNGVVSAVFPAFPMLKGKYNLDVYLMCERGLHIYEAVLMAAELNVKQRSLARGLVELPHRWE